MRAGWIIVAWVLLLAACTRYPAPEQLDGGAVIDLRLLRDSTIDGGDARALDGADLSLDGADLSLDGADLSLDGADLSPSDLSPVDMPTGVVVPTTLSAKWSAPNSIRWKWAVSGPESDFLAYELVVAESAAEVVARTGTARVITKGEAPELGVFRLPNTDSDQVVETSSYGLDADKSYFAQLVVYDIHGGVAGSPLASARTMAEPTEELVFFADRVVAGDTAIPVEMTLDSTSPYSGAECLLYDGSVCNVPPTCYEMLRVQGSTRDMSFVDAAIFGKLIAEVAVAHDGSEPSYWSSMRVFVDNNASSSSQVYSVSPLTIPANGAYTLVQVPLAVMHPWGDEDQPVLDLAALHRGLFELGIGGQWGEGAMVRVDQLRLRW